VLSQTLQWLDRFGVLGAPTVAPDGIRYHPLADRRGRFGMSGLGLSLELVSAEITLEDNTKRKRPTKAMALLRDASSNKSPVPHALAFLAADGSREPMNGFDKGHVIARQFIGNDADQNGNIVPLDPTFNRSGLWKQLELELHAQVKQGKNILMEVEIEYLGDSPLIPSSLIVSARDQKSLSYATFNGLNLKRARFTPPDIQPVQMSDDDLRADYGDELCKYIVELDKWFATNIDVKTYDIGKQPFLTGARLGPFGVPRPYQCLDFAFALTGTNPVITFCTKNLTITNGLAFHSRQRDLIQLVNRIRNGGWLVTDDPGADPYKGHLTTGSGADAGHVDHIHPKAQAGANAFSNARLVSRKHNETTKDTQKVTTS
jgi:hypothetical protein